jgi:hypothetical protein
MCRNTAPACIITDLHANIVYAISAIVLCGNNNGGCNTTTADCFNTPLGHTCACKAGFTGDGTTCELACMDCLVSSTVAVMLAAGG